MLIYFNQSLKILPGSFLICQGILKSGKHHCPAELRGWVADVQEEEAAAGQCAKLIYIFRMEGMEI